jgi:hypothetical protein
MHWVLTLNTGSIFVPAESRLAAATPLLVGLSMDAGTEVNTYAVTGTGGVDCESALFQLQHANAYT